MKTKRKLTLLITCILLFAMSVLPVSAAENTNAENTAAENTAAEISAVTTVNDAVVLGTSGSNYFRKITPQLSSLGSLSSANLSSGSCSGDVRSITSVTVYCRVSNGSDSFRLVVTSPSGTTKYVSCSNKSDTYTISGFNGEDPKGTWTVGIISNGISTVTCTLTVNYNYYFN